jgi:hypothetical protein
MTKQEKYFSLINWPLNFLKSLKVLTLALKAVILKRVKDNFMISIVTKLQLPQA